MAALLLVAAAAVLAVIAGIVATSRSTDTAPPVSPTPTPVSPSPTTAKSQSPQTWVDTPVAARPGEHGWAVPDPLQAIREGWFTVVAEHLHPSPRPAEWGQGAFELPAEGSLYSADGEVGVIGASSAEGLLANGCAYLHPTPNLDRDESCHTKQTRGPNGEPVHVTSFQSLCTTWDADSAAPGVYYKNCGDYSVTVVVERNDGRIGYIDVQGRDHVEAMPFALADLVAAAADPRLALPDRAFEVPSDRAVQSVVAARFPRYVAGDGGPGTDHPGHAWALGRLGRLGLSVQVWPADGLPTCGRDWVIDCVERRVYGADDPTTVYVGAWDEEEAASCCVAGRDSSRGFVFVGPRHTVLVTAFLVVPEGGNPVSPDLDRGLIDLALDPGLQ